MLESSIETARAAIANGGALLRSIRERLIRSDSDGLAPVPAHDARQRLSARPLVAFSGTVFSGDVDAWLRYLATPLDQRHERGVSVRAELHRELHDISFVAESAESVWLAQLLSDLFRWLRVRASSKPNVGMVLDELLWPATGVDVAQVLLSAGVPSTGTRESPSQASAKCPARFVLQSKLVRDVRAALEARRHDEDGGLGLAWPLVSRLLSQFAWTPFPRDRYLAKIDGFAKLLYLTLNVLYIEARAGQLVPNAVGVAFEEQILSLQGLTRTELFRRDPYFRALKGLSFVLRAKPYVEYAEEARIVARDYLDADYLRLSLASVMPEPPPNWRPRVVERQWGRLRASRPHVGVHGILNRADQRAWRRLETPFREIGFILLRQIGIGDFGRVYEALNEHDGQLPERVALKVDRDPSRRRQTILNPEDAMSIGSELARAPHLVRLYDTGRLQRAGSTYHVLQLVDGDTLDSLMQLPGPEGSQSETERLRGEWRRRVGRPFTVPLSVGMVFDVLTSMLLMVEEVHALGYAFNDLKTDNLMLSRRGQLKGIDLDAFSRIYTAHDKMTDFLFLAATLLLFVFNAPSRHPRLGARWKELAASEGRLRDALAQWRPLGEVFTQSEGRVSQREVSELVVDLVQRCHGSAYARDPQLFSADISRVIGVKRRLHGEEIVAD